MTAWGASWCRPTPWVESGRVSSDTVADAIHAALDDMRLVVDSLEPVEGDLLSILATVRSAASSPGWRATASGSTGR
jgi:signal transduction histidine kinase